jgi:predicted GNAT superfamily acetyltransferase
MRIRRASSYADYECCVDLQEMTWGANTRETVPAHLLSICQKVGGLVALAVDDSDAPLGFVFGVAGFRGDARVQWSHMLAVHPEARNQGIGRALKWYQREAALVDEVTSILWTFDPLVARNAYLNLNVLGAVVDRYETDMYGTPEGNTIYAAYGTDRFVARWDIESERVHAALARAGGEVDPHPTARAVGEGFDLEIPWDVARMVDEDLSRVVTARDALRGVVPARLAAGEEITELIRDPIANRCSYRFEVPRS